MSKQRYTLFSTTTFCLFMKNTLLFLTLIPLLSLAQIKPDQALPGTNNSLSSTLCFTENRGQWDPAIISNAPTPYGFCRVLPNGLSFAFMSSKNVDSDSIAINQSFIQICNFNFINPSALLTVNGSVALPQVHYYYKGNIDSTTAKSCQNHATYLYKNVWNDIDVHVYGNSKRQLEYDLILKPGSDPENIAFILTGHNDIYPENDGSLVQTTALGIVKHSKPIAYQIINGSKKEIRVDYILRDDTLKFMLGQYNQDFDLVIDPIIYGTWVNGQNEQGMMRDMCTDAEGQVYMTGHATSGDFPTTAGSFNSVKTGSLQDAFISKFDTDGKQLLFTAFLCGSNMDAGKKIVVDKNNIYLTGETLSEDFTISSNALDKVSGNIYLDAFYAIISLNGNAMQHCSFFGGNGEETISAMLIDNGILYFGGRSGSTDLNLTSNSPNKTLIGSYDAFLVAYHSVNNRMVFVNQFGGSGDENIECIAVDQQAVYTGGYTFSAGFYCTSDALIKNYIGEQEGTIVSFDKLGKKILYSSYFGGSDKDIISSIKIELGQLYATGITLSNNFPVTANAIYVNFAKNRNGFAFKMDLKSKSLIYCTYIPATFKVENTRMEVKMGIAMIANVLSFKGGQYVSEYLCDTNQLKNNDIYVCALNESGSAFKYGTFLGAQEDEIFPSLSWRNCEITLGFNSYSSGLPTTNGAWMEQRISATESAIAWFKIKPNFEFLQLKTLKKLAPKYNLCQNGKVTLNSGYTLTLWPDGSIDSIFNTSKPGKYKMKIFIGCDSIYLDSCSVDSFPTQVYIGRDTTFCNKNFKLKLTSNQDSTYWSTGARSKSIIVQNPGIYWANSNARCSNRVTDSITVTYLPEDDWVKLPPDTAICKGSKLILKVKSEKVIWSNGVSGDQNEISTPGLYTVSTINSCKNRIRDTIMIDTVAIKKFMLPPDTLICKKSVHFNLNTHLAGTYWSSGETDSLKTIVEEGTYMATFTNACGYSHSDTFTLKTDTSNIQFNLGKDTSFCGHIDGYKLSSGFHSTFWSTGERGTYILVNDSGIYYAENRNICFESYTDSIRLSIIDFPKVVLPKDTFICGKTNVLLDAGYDNARWQNGETNRYFTAQHKGLYHASMINQCGYSRDTFMIKTDTAIRPFFIPNAFSPGNDGLNETFPVKNISEQVFSLKVYNRWGQLVYEGNDVWDGKNVEQGVYMWQLDYRDCNFTPFFIYGNVTLLK